MEHQDTIESRVASAILEKPTDEVKIGADTYKVSPPSIATLVLVSEIIAGLPVVPKTEDDKILNSVLHYARHFRKLGDIAAILILGAKGLTEKKVTRKEIEVKRFFGLIRHKETRDVVEIVNRKERLAKDIIENMGARQLYDLIVQRLGNMEVSYFFAITTSLSEANMLKPTKEVVA